MDGKVTIYYDGTCTMCSGFVDKIQKGSQESRFESVDASEGHLGAGISKEEAMHEVHVVDEKGRIHSGADGILAVLAQYPGWRWAAKLGHLPGIHFFVRLGYRIVAANRHRFN
ncbi:MAG: DUF393 domain-containing protein [Candidatus Kaiserbacteria bacterium]|nr:MAG: DUF393 domain-containing protein [Candidatus Kaiserbacteria bacterium]